MIPVLDKRPPKNNRKLVRQSQGQKVFLIIGGHPVHTPRKGKDWVAKHTDEIELFVLPSYNPQVNPDGELSQDVKTNALGTQRPRSADQLKALVRSYLHRRQKQPHIVQRSFREPHVPYAAA